MKTTKTTKPQTLPDKPSALILLALHDLAKVERQKKKFVVDMGAWVERLNGKCAVCLAGSVMVSTLGLPLPEGRYDEIVPMETRFSRKLYALNYFRGGEMDDAFHALQLAKPDAIPDDIKVASYSNKTTFKRDMRKMAALLAKHGQ